ncbi:MAG: hypothetical protein ABI863_01030 [Ginsengibacter sp.]
MAFQKTEKNICHLIAEIGLSKKANAATIASIVSAILSLFFAVLLLKTKIKFQAFGQLSIDPVFIVLIVWLFIYFMLR